MRRISQRLLLTYVITLVAAVVFVVLTVKVSGAFVTGLIFTVMFGVAALVLVACPKCGKCVLIGDQKAFGVTVKSHVLILFPVPKECPKCGHQL